MKDYRLSELKAICEKNTIVDENGKKYCDVERCPFAKRGLDINFHPTDWYRCTADYPYLKEKHETEEEEQMKDLDKLIADRLIEAIGRDTVDRFEEDESGNLAKISLISLEYLAKEIAADIRHTYGNVGIAAFATEYLEWLKANTVRNPHQAFMQFLKDKGVEL